MKLQLALQFESPVVEAAMYLLDYSKLYAPARKSPAFVSRVLSALVNSLDDDGVLVGNWSGDYSGGTAPTAWTGSVEILQEFMHYKRPVSYGQCWVFSAVTTSRELKLDWLSFFLKKVTEKHKSFNCFSTTTSSTS